MMMINAYPQNEKRLEHQRRVGVTPTTFFEVLRIREFAILLLRKWYLWVGFALVFATAISQSVLIPAPYSATGTVRVNTTLPSSEFYSERFYVETEKDLLRSYDIIGQALDKLGYYATIYPVRTKLAQLAYLEPTGLVQKISNAKPIPLVDHLHIARSTTLRKLLRGQTYLLTFDKGMVNAVDEYGVPVATAPVGDPLILDIGKVELSEINYTPLWQYRLKVFDRHNMIRLVQSLLEIRPEPLKGGGGLMHLQLTHYDQKFVNAVINALIDVYVAHGEQHIKGDIAESISELEQRKLQISEEIETLTTNIERIQKQRKIIDPKYDANKLTEEIMFEEQQLNLMLTRRTKLLRDVTAIHPTVKTIDEKIAAQRGVIEELHSKQKILPVIVRDIKENRLGLESATNNLITVNEKLVQLNSYVTISKNYVQKIHGATPRHKPYRSKIMRLFTLSTIFGAILGMLFIIITGSNKVKKIKSLSDIAASTRLPIFCRLRRERKEIDKPRDSNGNLVTWTHVANNIPYLFVGGNAKPIVIQPTSIQPVNYHFIENAVKAHSEEISSLVIDFDFQRRKFTEKLGALDKQGALEILAGVKAIDECTVSISENFDFIPAGSGLATHSVEDIVEIAHTLVQQASVQYDQVFVVMPAEPQASQVGSSFGYVLITASIGVSKQQFTQLFRDYDPEERATAVVVID